MFASLFVRVGLPAFLTHELVRVESSHYKLVDLLGRDEFAFAIGAVRVIFQPTIYAFTAEELVTLDLTALSGVQHNL